MPVVGALLLLAVDWNLRAVHVQHTPRARINCFRPSNQFAVEPGQTGEVLRFGQHFRLEGLQPRSQGCATVPGSLRTDQPKRRILRYSLGAVDVLVTRQSAVDRLPKKVGQLNLRIPSTTGVGQVLCDEFTQAQAFIRRAYHDETAVGGDPR